MRNRCGSTRTWVRIGRRSTALRLQLAAAIAHEVRNPLAVVRSAAQGLTETLPPDDPDGRRAAGFIMAEIDRLSNVVGSLLAFARPLRLEARPVPLRAVLDRAVALA